MKKLMNSCLAGACLLALGACASEAPKTTGTTPHNPPSSRDLSAKTTTTTSADRPMAAPPPH